MTCTHAHSTGPSAYDFVRHAVVVLVVAVIAAPLAIYALGAI